MKPKIFFLIGPPAVGKSTWIASAKKSGKVSSNAVTINRDEMVEKIAKETGVGNYDEMFAKPPKEITPPGIPSKEILEDPTKNEEVEAYLKSIEIAADKYNRDPANATIVGKYGILVPFGRDDLDRVIAKYGVKPEFIIPFEYSKIKEANTSVSNLLDNTRKESSIAKKDIIIDMTNMSRAERDSHRKFLIAAIEQKENPTGSVVQPRQLGSARGNDADVNPHKLAEYYDQYAIVFAPDGGYTPEIIENVKKVAAKRAAEIKASGGSKEIPPSVYDVMFSKYQEPSMDEGFVKIEYVGIPSLKRLNERFKYLKTYEGFIQNDLLLY